MKKILLIIVLTFLSIGCFSETQPYIRIVDNKKIIISDFSFCNITYCGAFANNSYYKTTYDNSIKLIMILNNHLTIFFVDGQVFEFKTYVEKVSTTLANETINAIKISLED